MSIEKFIAKVCVQTAVYWGNPRPDGYGGRLYEDPREVMVRWDDKQQQITAPDGQVTVSNAELLVTEDLDLDGVLWLGHLADLPPGDVPAEAREIKARDKIPMIKKTDQFIRKVYLSNKVR